jgi:2-keto-4-pentenoate hydratase
MTTEAVERLDAFLSASREKGLRHVGYKAALISSAAQRRMNSAGPVWGALTDDMAVTDGAQVDLSTVASAKAEVELVFQLGSDLVGPGVTEAHVLSATAAVYVGIEIPAVSVGSEPPTNTEDLLRSNALAWRYVLGQAATRFHGIDMSLVGAILEVNGEVTASGAGAGILGSPARSVAWLANRLASYGKELHAEMLVFSGALTDPVALAPGQSVSVEIAHVGRAALGTRLHRAPPASTDQARSPHLLIRRTAWRFE